MKKTHIIGLIVIAIGVGVLLKMLSSEFSRYETFGSNYALSGKEINVVGALNKEDEMYYNPHLDANLFTFFMTDDAGETRKVIYKGTKPQDFEKTEKIVVIGKLKKEEFYAKKILMKCPSKYVEAEVVTSSQN